MISSENLSFLLGVDVFCGETIIPKGTRGSQLSFKFTIRLYSRGGNGETFFKLAVNNEIIASSVTNKVGSSLPYYHCLEYLIEKKKEQTYPATLHTDQGSVYSSAGFYQTHKDYTNIIRSMSRAGTPTDNPIIESLNGWIKEEMGIDFNLKAAEGIPSFIEKYVHYFNNERLYYKLNYKTPVQYRIEQGFE